MEDLTCLLETVHTLNFAVTISQYRSHFPHNISTVMRNVNKYWTCGASLVVILDSTVAICIFMRGRGLICISTDIANLHIHEGRGLICISLILIRGRHTVEY